MSNETMLYKFPGHSAIHGGMFDYIIVDADEDGALDKAKADGWSLTTPEARAAFDAEQARLGADVKDDGTPKFTPIVPKQPKAKPQGAW